MGCSNVANAVEAALAALEAGDVCEARRVLLLLRKAVSRARAPCWLPPPTSGPLPASPSPLARQAPWQPQGSARETVERELPEAERRCACCAELQQRAGHAENQFLRYTPARVTLVTERVWQYACGQACGEPVAAPSTPKLIDNSLCSSSLLSQLVVGRVLDANPTERCGRQLVRHGVELARSTLYDWFAHAGQQAESLTAFVCELLLGSDLVSLDDTLADSICDRLVHNAHRLKLRGESMRKAKESKPTLTKKQTSDK